MEMVYEMSNNGQNMSFPNLQQQFVMDAESHYRLQAAKCQDDEILLTFIMSQIGSHMKIDNKMIKIDKESAKLVHDDGIMFQAAILPYGAFCLWGSLFGTPLSEWQVMLINRIKGDTIESAIKEMIPLLHFAKLSKKDSENTDEDDQTDSERFPHLII